MTLPILLSVPHAGLWVPPEAGPCCQLTSEQVARDGDQGAAEIYFGLRDSVAALVTTEVARAIVDMNRAEDDRRPDGVVKTHTCWNDVVYRDFPPEELIAELLDKYYRPYHSALIDGATRDDVRLCIDCHTMLAVGPPIGPGEGIQRPFVCLGDGRGTTLPAGWLEKLAACFAAAFDRPISLNDPFSGGFITRSYGRQNPWLQLELSRAPFMSNQEKQFAVLQALTDFCKQMV